MSTTKTPDQIFDTVEVPMPTGAGSKFVFFRDVANRGTMTKLSGK
jgi:hypothetical protein